MTLPFVAGTVPAAPAPPATSQTLNLKLLLEEVIERNASDLHITAGERPKLRVDGDIVNSKIEYVLQPKDTMQLAYSVLTENQKKRFEMDDELDFSFGIQHLVDTLPALEAGATALVAAATLEERQIGDRRVDRDLREQRSRLR